VVQATSGLLGPFSKFPAPLAPFWAVIDMTVGKGGFPIAKTLRRVSVLRVAVTCGRCVRSNASAVQRINPL
jgi:hypothetical protein